MNNKRSKNKTKRNIKKIMKGGTRTKQEITTYLMNLNSNDDKNIAEASEQILSILKDNNDDDIELLLNTRVFIDKSIYHLAAKLDDPTMIKTLSTFKSKYLKLIHAESDRHGNTPFHYATTFGKTENLQSIFNSLDKDMKLIAITKINKNKHTPLHLACIHGHINTITTLIDLWNSIRGNIRGLFEQVRIKDKFFNFLDSNNLTPICHFIKNINNISDDDIINGIKLLTDNGSYMGIIGETSIPETIAQQSLNKVYSSDETLPQHILCQYSTEYVIDKIFSSYNIQIPNPFEKKNIFHYLVIRNFYKIIEKFIDNENKDDVYQSAITLDEDEKGAMRHMILYHDDNKSFVPLHYACSQNENNPIDENEKLETVKLLIGEYEKLLHGRPSDEAPAWLEITRNRNPFHTKITPIMQACISKLSIIFKFLFDKLKPEDKIKLFKQKDINGKTLLHIVCKILSFFSILEM